MGMQSAAVVSVLLLVACLSTTSADKKADDCVDTRAGRDKTRDIALVNTARFHQEVGIPQMDRGILYLLARSCQGQACCKQL
jgi:hypothetical protein